jgi:hypothetical protein
MNSVTLSFQCVWGTNEVTYKEGATFFLYDFKGNVVEVKVIKISEEEK